MEQSPARTASMPIPAPGANQTSGQPGQIAASQGYVDSGNLANDVIPATFRQADDAQEPKEKEKPASKEADAQTPKVKDAPLSKQSDPAKKSAPGDKAAELLPPAVPAAAVPADSQKSHRLAIDLPYALRLANASNPTISAAIDRTRQALAAQMAAKVSFLPDIWIGGNPDNYVFLPTYYNHTGFLQNASGNVFTTDKHAYAFPAGASINYKLSDVIFAPFIARDNTAAAEARARATRFNIQLDVALTYLDLVRAFGALAINRESLARAQYMYDVASQAIKNDLSKTTADANRAKTEVEMRKQERFELEGDAATAAARLAQLLLLQPSVDLVPADPRVVPVALVSPGCEIEELIAISLMNRPELAESRALVAAAYKKWKQDRSRPFLPTLSLIYYASPYGGSSFLFPDYNGGGRQDFIAQAAWDLKNLGFGDAARIRQSRAARDEANMHLLEVQAQVAAEVTAAAKLSRLRAESIHNAQEAVQQAETMWTRLSKAAFGMVGGPRRYDPLEPLIAEQQLNAARMKYLDEVINFNRYQFRLYWAMGQPPLSALPQAKDLPLEVPVLPSEAQQEGKDREQ